MTDYTLTEDDRKLMTEKVLGEKWKVPENITEVGTNYFPVNNRTFTTLDDFFALVKALQKKDIWYDFLRFALLYIRRGIERIRRAPRGQMLSEIDNPMEMQYCTWLLNPARLAWMVKEFMKEEKK